MLLILAGSAGHRTGEAPLAGQEGGLSFANGFVQGLSSAGFHDTRKAASVHTDEGVLVAVFFPSEAAAQRVLVTPEADVLRRVRYGLDARLTDGEREILLGENVIAARYSRST